MNLDSSKIQGLHSYQGGWEGACPVCRRRGDDPWCDKLRIFPSGAYQCENYPNNRKHNQYIHELAGDHARQEPYFVDRSDGGGIMYVGARRPYFTKRGTKFEEFVKRQEAKAEREAQKAVAKSKTGRKRTPPVKSAVRGSPSTSGDGNPSTSS